MFKRALLGIVKMLLLIQTSKPFSNSFSLNYFQNKVLRHPAMHKNIKICQEKCNKLIADIKIHSKTLSNRNNHNKSSKENIVHGCSIQWED